MKYLMTILLLSYATQGLANNIPDHYSCENISTSKDSYVLQIDTSTTEVSEVRLTENSKKVEVIAILEQSIDDKAISVIFLADDSRPFEIKIPKSDKFDIKTETQLFNMGSPGGFSQYIDMSCQKVQSF